MSPPRERAVNSTAMSARSATEAATVAVSERRVDAVTAFPACKAQRREPGREPSRRQQNGGIQQRGKMIDVGEKANGPARVGDFKKSQRTCRSLDELNQSEKGARHPGDDGEEA